MDKKDYGDVCNTIMGFSPYIRFTGVIGESGELLAYARRKDLEPLLDSKDAHYQFSHIAIKTDLESFFDKKLGRVEFVWEEREKVQIISFAINRLSIWISIDRMVVRSEVLRIIDSCLPIAQRYSGMV